MAKAGEMTLWLEPKMWRLKLRVQNEGQMSDAIVASTRLQVILALLDAQIRPAMREALDVRVKPTEVVWFGRSCNDGVELTPW